VPELAPLLTAADLPDLADATTVAEEVTAAIREHCGWHVAPAWAEVLELDGQGGTLLTLPTLRLTAVALVEVDGVAVTDYTWSRRGQLRRWAGWPTGFRSVAVTVTHGYPEVPRIVVAAGRAAGKRELENPRKLRSASALGVSEVYTVPATGEPYGVSLSKVEQRMVARYKLPPRP
jgi:hypothetical protein